MQFTTLGRTGLQVSVVGLGCGGHSRLGLAAGKSEAEAIALVRQALARGINFFDTAEGYGTEGVVGQALQGVLRETVVLSTKVSPRQEGRLLTATELKARVQDGLQRLRTDYVDILHLHGVSAEHYEYAVSEFVPVLRELRQEGKVRFIGITEAFASDPTHQMLVRALQDDYWDVLMVGFNFLNQSARERVLVQTQARGIGTLCMFAVRRALSQPAVLQEVMQSLSEQGLIDLGEFSSEELSPLLQADVSPAVLTDLAYRFCRYEPGLDVILSGTGNLAHLDANVASLNAPPLPAAQVAMLKHLFRQVDSISGN